MLLTYPSCNSHSLFRTKGIAEEPKEQPYSFFPTSTTHQACLLLIEPYQQTIVHTVS